jgi:hypothetical protein
MMLNLFWCIDVPWFSHSAKHKEVMVRSKARSSWRVSVAWATSSHNLCHATKDSCGVHLKPSNWFDTFVDGQSRIGSKSNGLILENEENHNCNPRFNTTSSEKWILARSSLIAASAVKWRDRQGLPGYWAVDCVVKICQNPWSLIQRPTQLWRAAKPGFMVAEKLWAWPS